MAAAVSRQMRRHGPVLALALLLLLPARALAQRTDIIRGRVTDDSGRAVSGADVVATRAYDLQTFDTTTDAAGRYQLTITPGRQDYLLFVSKPGFKPFEKRVQPAPGDSVIHGDVVLQPAPPQELRAVRTQAAPARPPRRNFSMNGGPGGDEMNEGGVTAGLNPDQMGDLNAISQLMPGAASGTMFGLPADGNGMLLDGLAFQGGTLPRDASVRTQIASSAYDPSRGGFSGLQVTSTIEGGSVMNQRTMHVTLDAPVLEYNDPVAARVGDRFAQTSIGGGASGATAFEHLFYNVSGQYTRRLSSTSDLLNADPALSYAAGLAPDSAQRMVAVARNAGIPVAALGFPSDQVTDHVVFLGRFDTPKSMDAPGSKNLWSLLVYGNLTRRQGLGFAATTAPSVGHDERSAMLTAQVVRSLYFGPHDSWLNETRTGFTSNTRHTSPWVAGPAAHVLVVSTLPDGSGAVSAVALGGAGNDGARNRSWTWETTNTTQWYVHGRANTLKLYADSRFDGYTRWSPGTDLGAFSYNSLADLAANQPASYTRTLQSPTITGSAWSGALALGDVWRRSPTFEMEGGLRLEAAATCRGRRRSAGGDGVRTRQRRSAEYGAPEPAPRVHLGGRPGADHEPGRRVFERHWFLLPGAVRRPARRRGRVARRALADPAVGRGSGDRARRRQPHAGVPRRRDAGAGLECLCGQSRRDPLAMRRWVERRVQRCRPQRAALRSVVHGGAQLASESDLGGAHPRLPLSARWHLRAQPRSTRDVQSELRERAGVRAGG